MSRLDVKHCLRSVEIAEVIRSETATVYGFIASCLAADDGRSSGGECNHCRGMNSLITKAQGHRDDFVAGRCGELL